MKDMNITGMTINDLDAAIIRPRGTAAKVGNVKFLVACGRDYDAQIVSAHRTSRGAASAAREEGQIVWMWDSYMGTGGGFRVM